MTIEECLDKAEEIIQKPSFRKNKGLGNEVGYYIFDYPADKELYCLERKKTITITELLSLLSKVAVK